MYRYFFSFFLHNKYTHTRHNECVKIIIKCCLCFWIASAAAKCWRGVCYIHNSIIVLTFIHISDYMKFKVHWNWKDGKKLSFLEKLQEANKNKFPHCYTTHKSFYFYFFFLKKRFKTASDKTFSSQNCFSSSLPISFFFFWCSTKNIKYRILENRNNILLSIFFDKIMIYVATMMAWYSSKRPIITHYYHLLQNML